MMLITENQGQMCTFTQGKEREGSERLLHIKSDTGVH